jgi:POT family proton-dependent oligopeptide transporter
MRPVRLPTTHGPGDGGAEGAVARTFLGQPRGLAFIAFTEAWERFSFYGMQALLMLYMTQYLLQPEHVVHIAGFGTFRRAIESVFGSLSIQALASQIFGLYVALVYFMPVLGGWLGDRALGRTRAVVLGAVSMAIGHFLMAFEASFLAALSAIIVGSGLLKGNLASQVGALYEKGDGRRDIGYTIYIVAINVGAFVAPLVCGTLGEVFGWHYGFGVAGIAMLVSIAIYLSGLRHLPPENLGPSGEAAPKLEEGDGRVVAVILLMLLATSLFWTIQAQVWNVYPLWIRDFVDRGVAGGLAVPVTWFQALDALTVLLLAPGAMWLWRRQAARGTEPGDLAKLALGNLLFGASCVFLALGQWVAGERLVTLFWPTVFHFFVAAGYLYSAPIVLALVSRLAPAAVNAMLVGANYLGIFIGGILSGWLGRFYEPLGPMKFWLMHALIGVVGAVFTIVLGRLFGDVFSSRGRALQGTDPPAA